MRFYIIIGTAALLAGCGGPVNDAKKAAAALLKDPSSAQFRNIMQGAGAVCGEINGKNAYGAYAGYSKFVWNGMKATIEPEGGTLGDPDIAQIIAVEDRTEFLRQYNQCLSASG